MNQQKHKTVFAVSSTGRQISRPSVQKLTKPILSRLTSLSLIATIDRLINRFKD